MEEDIRHHPLIMQTRAWAFAPTLAHMITYMHTTHTRTLSFGFGLFLPNLGSFESSSLKHLLKHNT